MNEQFTIAQARAEVIASFQASLKAHQIALEAALEADEHDYWVLENQGFYLSFDTAGKPHSCGLLQARIFTGVTEAHALSRVISNGNGRKPLVTRYEAALAHEIRSLEQSIASLQEA